MKNTASLLNQRLKFWGDIVISSSDRTGEKRFLAVGITEHEIITVIFTRRNHVIRIISARKARKKEKADYGEVHGR